MTSTTRSNEMVSRSSRARKCNAKPTKSSWCVTLPPTRSTSHKTVAVVVSREIWQQPWISWLMLGTSWAKTWPSMRKEKHTSRLRKLKNKKMVCSLRSQRTPRSRRGVTGTIWRPGTSTRSLKTLLVYSRQRNRDISRLLQTMITR